MSTFVVSATMAVISLLLIMITWFFASDTYREKIRREPSFPALIFILVVAFILAILAHANIYFNGTEEELLRWMFWFRG